MCLVHTWTLRKTEQNNKRVSQGKKDKSKQKQENTRTPLKSVCERVCVFVLKRSGHSYICVHSVLEATNARSSERCPRRTHARLQNKEINCSHRHVRNAPWRTQHTHTHNTHTADTDAHARPFGCKHCMHADVTETTPSTRFANTQKKKRGP